MGEKRVADEALDSHLSACRRLVAASMFRMPGQAAPSASQHDFLNYRLAPPVGPLPAVHPRQAVGDSQPDAGPIMGYTTRVCKLDLTWEAMLDRKLVAAIRKWTAIILRCPPAFDLGRRADSAKPLGDQLPAMLKHVFSGRSQGTLHARAGPILRYIMWCDKNEVRPIPFHESAMYDFCTASESDCAPTFLRSLVTSLSFCHHVMGAWGAKDCLESGRLTGVARHVYLRKRKRLQRPPFTVDMLRDLETMVCDPAVGATDRICAGFFVLATYMRGRYSDTQAMRKILVDKRPGSRALGGYLEALVSRTKASFTTERKTMLLPMVCPRAGLSGLDWFQAWTDARKERSVLSGEGIPVLPGLASASGWTGTPPSAATAGSWLRGLLGKLGYAPEVVKGYGTHSCKTTLLSFCAKFGIDSFHRRVLGYHSQPGDRVMHIYSRDTVSASVRGEGSRSGA